MATLKNTTINDTGYLQLPSGTTAQRPSSPATGYIRWNTDNACIEAYDGSNWGCVESVGYEGIPVTTGLIAGFQADNPDSYSGTGTTVYDISGNGNNATLVNGPTYTSGNGSWWNFDGTNDEMTYSCTITPAASVVTIARSKTTNWNDYSGLGAERAAGGFIMHNDINSANWRMYWYGSSSASITVGVAGLYSDPDAWGMYTITTNGSTSNIAYHNSSQVGSSTQNASRTASNNVTIRLAKDDYSGRYNSMELHAHLLYNRQLSSAEVSSLWTYFSNKLP